MSVCWDTCLPHAGQDITIWILVFFPWELHTQRGQCILFSVVFSPSPPATTAVFGLTNTVSPMRVCLTIWWESFRGNQKEDDCGPHSIQSSLYTQFQTRCFWRPKVRRRKVVVGFREKEMFTNLRSFRDIRLVYWGRGSVEKRLLTGGERNWFVIEYIHWETLFSAKVSYNCCYIILQYSKFSQENHIADGTTSLPPR
jgi:hypothetical protein